jgi:hypothetical protein
MAAAVGRRCLHQMHFEGVHICNPDAGKVLSYCKVMHLLVLVGAAYCGMRLSYAVAGQMLLRAIPKLL